MTTPGEEVKLVPERISKIESNQRLKTDGWAIASFILAVISYPLSPILLILFMYMSWNSPSTISIGTVALLRKRHKRPPSFRWFLFKTHAPIEGIPFESD